MKSSALAKILESYAKASLLPNSVEVWTGLASLLASAKNKEVAVLFQDLQSLEVEPQREGRFIAELVPEISPMQATAIALGKAPVADALKAITLLIERCPAITVESLQAALAVRAKVQSAKTSGSKRTAAVNDPTIVPSYNKRLEEALGHEQGFDDVMAALEADQRLKATDFKQLAKTFTGQAGRNKADSLEIIRARHLNLLDGRAKSEFNTGKTAA